MDKEKKLKYLTKNFDKIEKHISVFSTKDQVMYLFSASEDLLNKCVKLMTKKKYGTEMTYHQLEKKIQTDKTSNAIDMLYKTARKSTTSSEYIIKEIIIKNEEKEREIEEEIEKIKNIYSAIMYFPVGDEQCIKKFIENEQKEIEQREKNIEELVKKYELDNKEYYKRLEESINLENDFVKATIKKINLMHKDIFIYISNFITKKEILDTLNVDEKLFDYAIYNVISPKHFCENLTYRKLEKIIQAERNADVLNNYYNIATSGQSNKSLVFYMDNIIKRRQEQAKKNQEKIDKEKAGIKQKIIAIPVLKTDSVKKFNTLAVNQQKELQEKIYNLMRKYDDFGDSIERKNENDKINEAKKNR